MANKTTNYDLSKPIPSEFYDVEVQNGNMDKIDAQMKANADGIKALQNEQKNKADLVGGKVPTSQIPAMDYISRPEAKALVDQGVSNANEYTDRKIAAIPAPDVSGQIQAHDANHTAHGDIRQALAAHEINRENPHGVTAEQAGAAPAAHVNDAVKHITAEERTAWNGKANEADLSIHTGNKNNPHNVTAEQVGAIAAGAVGNLHVWKKEKRSYTIKLSSGVTGQISIGSMNKTIQYSYQIYMVGRKVALKNPVTLTYPDEALNGIGSAVKGNYLCVPGGKVYYAEYYEDDGDYLAIGCKDVTLSYHAKTTDYLTYKTASVYPYDDEVDGYHYTYLGQLGEPRETVEVGSYVGTGTYGSSNPCSYTFHQEPVLVFIVGRDGYSNFYQLVATNSGAYLKCPVLLTKKDDASENSESPNGVKGVSASFSGNTFTWYNTGSSDYQLNVAGFTYTIIGVFI